MPGLTLIQHNNGTPPQAAAEAYARMQAIVTHFDDYTSTRHELTVTGGLVGAVRPPLRGQSALEWESGDGQLRVIVDGEIANAAELSADRPLNEAAVVADLYQQDPTGGFLPRLHGWFNLVVVDRCRSRILLANDLYGIRPLYYSETSGMLVVCGEVKGVVAALGKTPEIDPEAVADLFAFDGVLNERTLFKEIMRMPPASCWIWADGAWSRRQYRRPEDSVPDRKLGREELFDAADACFQSVLPRYLKDDYCFSLTGGNDTRVMMSMLGTLPRPDFCFTYGFTNHTADILLARQVVARMDLDHRSVRMGKEFLSRFADYANDAIWISDGLSDIMSSSILHVHADHRNRYVAGGKYGTQVARGVRQRIWQLAGLPNLDVLSSDLREQISGAPAESLETARSEFSAVRDSSDADLLFTVMKECRHHWGGKLALENAVVGVRTPFTDPDVIGLTLQLPSDMTDNAGIQHELMRRHNVDLAALPTNRGLLPLRRDALAPLRAKLFQLWFKGSVVCNSRRLPPWLMLDHNFFANNVTTKFRTWFREDLAGYVQEMLLDPRTLGRSWLDADRVRHCVGQHIGRRHDYSAQISRLISFELFLRQFVDGDRVGRR